MCRDYQCLMLQGQRYGQYGHRYNEYFCMNCKLWKDVLRPIPVRLVRPVPNQISQVVPKKDSWADMVEMDKSLSPYSPSYFNTITKCFYKNMCLFRSLDHHNWIIPLFLQYLLHGHS